MVRDKEVSENRRKAEISEVENNGIHEITMNDFLRVK